MKIGVSTAEQAQVFLGVDEKTSDDFIITMYTAKVLYPPSFFLGPTFQLVLLQN